EKSTLTGTTGARNDEAVSQTVQLKHVHFEPLDFFPERVGDTMFGEIHLGHRDAKGLADFAWRPLFIYVKVKHLKSVMIDLSFHLRQGRAEDISFPFRVPDGAQVVVRF